MDLKRVAITGLGAISCLGPTADETWRELRAGHSGIRDGLGRVPDAWLASASGNRALDFSLMAAREAMAQAGWSILNPDDGVIFATTTGQILLWDYAFADMIAERSTVAAFREVFVHQPLGALVENFCFEVGHVGPSTLLTSACSASTQALGIGAMWIRQGRVKRCLVIGVEVLSDLTCEGFRSLQLLSPSPCQPFDLHRQGINLSEGAAALCLEAGTGLAFLSGYGFSSDGFHMTGPQPEGAGSARAMSSALRVARLLPGDIDWVHAHGTGSPANDSSEGAAIHNLFGLKPFVTSTKWSHGHALAASGTLESVLVVRALQEGFILPTRGLVEPDPAIDARHAREAVACDIRHVMKNTLGFGGANAAVVFSHPGAVAR